MLDNWFYTHAGLTLGPIPTEQLNGMVNAGQLSADEFVWPDGIDVQITVRAYLKMLRTGEAPDWLLDLQRTSTPAKVSAPPPVRSTPPAAKPQGGPLPNWLNDAPPAPHRPTPPPSPASSPPSVPDWLGDVQTNERRPAPPANSAPPGPLRPVAAAPTPQVPLDWLEDIRQIEASLKHRVPSPTPSAPAAAMPARLPVTPATRPVSPLPTPSRSPQPPPIPASTVAATEARADQLAVSVYEAFLSARRALERWVDEDCNEAPLRAGNLDLVAQAPQAENVFRNYAYYGPVMREKLRKHLQMLLENRRKYYAALKVEGK